VTVERRNVGEADAKYDRGNDRSDRVERNREDRDDLTEMRYVSYKSLSGIQKDVIQFCSIP